jgi:hypothetical protein
MAMLSKCTEVELDYPRDNDGTRLWDSPVYKQNTLKLEMTILELQPLPKSTPKAAAPRRVRALPPTGPVILELPYSP